MTGSRVAQFETIRRDAQREELSIRELARRHAVGRPTVRQALACSVPPERKTPVRRSPKLEPVKVTIDAMLLSDVTAPRKQRHTARRVLARLIDEHGAQDITYSAVRDYVARRRPEIAAEAGLEVENAFVLQTYLPGAEAEVDFGDVYVMLAGELTKCFLFTLRLSASGKACHAVFASQGQEAFIEGHLDAFNRLGGYVGVDPQDECVRQPRWRCLWDGADGLGTGSEAAARHRWAAACRVGPPSRGRLLGVRGGPVSAEHGVGDRL